MDGNINNRPSVVKFENESWFIDLQKLSNDELMRMYNAITTGKYEFAKNAWYIPLSGDKRCPIMVAKGYEAPETPEKMAEFQDRTRILKIHRCMGFWLHYKTHHRRGYSGYS